jgi:thiosulfate sulfurtransferase
MKKLLALTVLLSLSACGSASSSETAATSSSSGAEAAPAFAMMSVDEVAAGITETASPRLAVFDANSPETYAAGHVPGATWVDYDGVTAAVLPADTATPVVFYCANEHCSASHVAAETAIGLGYSRVAVMGAGIEGWQAAGQPTEAAAAPATATP